MPLPTWRTAVLLAASGVALLVVPVTSWAVFWAIELVVVAAFVADAFAGPSPRRIGVARDAPGALRVGDDATMVWTLANHSRNAVRVTITDALWPSLGASRRHVQVRLPGGASVRATATLIQCGAAASPSTT